MRYVATHNLRLPNTPRNRVKIDHATSTARIELIGKDAAGVCATIDLADLDQVLQVRWRLNSRHPRNWYAVGTVLGGKNESLHRFIMGLKPGDARQIDHIDGNGLNCTRENMRVCQPKENYRNTRKQARQCFSTYKGVSRDNRGGR